MLRRARASRVFHTMLASAKNFLSGKAKGASRCSRGLSWPHSVHWLPLVVVACYHALTLVSRRLALTFMVCAMTDHEDRGVLGNATNVMPHARAVRAPLSRAARWVAGGIDARALTPQRC